MIKIHKFDTYTWVEAISPTEDELNDITIDYRAPAKFKGYMLDRHEQPRATFGLVHWWSGQLRILSKAECSHRRFFWDSVIPC
ncbi:hypothetical protein OKF32_00600 [Lentilactobacillus buchneri]|nr:hypothetical protein OKF32_00600 [Lentilactobacillus sp. Egmn17]